MSKVNRRKLLKEPDEFLTFSEQAVQWCQENTRIVIYVVVLAVLAVGFGVGFKAYLDHRAEQAAAAMDQAFDTFAVAVKGKGGKAMTQAALRGLDRVVESYGATPAGIQARLALGALLLEKGKFKQAIPVFQELTQDTDTPQELLPLAWHGLGVALEGAKRYQEAAEAYAAAIAAAGPNLALGFRLDQARVLAAAGKREQAARYYRQVMKDAAGKTLAQVAKASLVDMGLDPGRGGKE